MTNPTTGSIAPSFPETPTRSGERPNSQWYLGIDFGTSGLSAALVDRQSGQLHPIYWETRQDSETPNKDVSESASTYRIECVAVLRKTANSELEQQITVKSVGCQQQALAAEEFLLPNLKLPLKVAIPYLRGTGVVYEPLLEFSRDRAISIAVPLNGLRALLATLNPRLQPNFEDLSIPNLICRASGLETEALDMALEGLQGVILGTPADWSDVYRFNVREAVLGAGLVGECEQIFVVEDAIATLLSAITPIQNANFRQSETVELINEENTSNRQLAVQPSSFGGGTLILNAGATTVELSLVDLPENSQNLTYTDFSCQSFAFAGNAFDQDIICQLLAKNETFGMSMNLPRPGHPDLPSRYELQQRLQSSDFGLQLLDAARHLKVILQHQESFVLDIGEKRWNVQRRDLESQVLVPFVQQLNRELNALLSRVGMSPVGINQAICAGGMGGWPAIARWLRQKLPNAIVVQYPEFEDMKISRVACGLANLALYPRVLDVSRQQYGNFCLLWELMQALGEAALSFEQIVQLLERRGVNTRTCESRILGILAGNWVAGLLPDRTDLMLLAPDSRQNPDWDAISATVLFVQNGDSLRDSCASRTYSLNIQHAAIVREYLTKLASSSQQKILEPLTIAWGIRDI